MRCWCMSNTQRPCRTTLQRPCTITEHTLPASPLGAVCRYVVRIRAWQKAAAVLAVIQCGLCCGQITATAGARGCSGHGRDAMEAAAGIPLARAEGSIASRP